MLPHAAIEMAMRGKLDAIGCEEGASTNAKARMNSPMIADPSPEPSGGMP